MTGIISFSHTPMGQVNSELILVKIQYSYKSTSFVQSRCLSVFGPIRISQVTVTTYTRFLAYKLRGRILNGHMCTAKVCNTLVKLQLVTGSIQLFTVCLITFCFFNIVRETYCTPLSLCVSVCLCSLPYLKNTGIYFVLRIPIIEQWSKANSSKEYISLSIYLRQAPCFLIVSFFRMSLLFIRQFGYGVLAEPANDNLAKLWTQ